MALLSASLDRFAALPASGLPARVSATRLCPLTPARHARPPASQVWRYYLVPQLASEPEVQLSFDDIYVMDGKAATLSRCEVHRLAPPDTPPQDLRLRIR